MSQNISSRRQKLLSQLHTTLAIVSQATGFDNERPAGDLRPTEQHQWVSSRDPRMRRQETYHEGAGVSEPGSNAAAAPPTVRSSTVTSSTLFQKFDEIQDEDEFLYGSGVPESASRQVEQVSHTSQDKRPDDRQIGHLQWATQRQVQNEDPRWAGAPASRQPNYTDPSPQAASQHADPRWMGNTESTRIGQMSDQSQWTHVTAQRGDGNSWGGRTQMSGYSEADDRQSMGRGPQMAAPPRNVGMQPESAVSKMAGINAGMLEGILKLVASGTATSASQPLPPQPLQQPSQQQLQQQQPLYQSQHAYGSGYPPQRVYSQPPDQRGYVPSGVLLDVPSSAGLHGQPRQFQHSTYDYGQAAPAPQQHHQSTDVNPLLSQLSTAFLNSKMAQTPTQPVTDDLQRITRLIEQANSRNQPSSSFRQDDTRMGSEFAGSRQVDRSVTQPNVTASVPSLASVLEKPLSGTPNLFPVGNVSQFAGSHEAERSMTQPNLIASTPSQTSVPERPQTGTPNLFPVGNVSQFAGSREAERSVTQPNVMASTPSQSSVPEKPQTGTPNLFPIGNVQGPATASQPDRTAATVEPDKGDGGQQRGEVSKDTLSQLLNMIGCGSNVTLLMKELMKKDEQEKMKKQQTPSQKTPAQQTPAQQDQDSAVPPAASQTQPKTAERDNTKPSIVGVSQTLPEPATEPASAAHDEKPNTSLAPDTAKEPEPVEDESAITVLSSLTRLQKNYDSPDENAEKDSTAASKTGDAMTSLDSSQTTKDDEWQRSTEAFLRQLQSKSTAPTQSQKEKSRSTSRDRTVKEKSKTKPEEGTKSAAKQSKSDGKKVKKDKHDARSEVSTAEIDSEREDLLRGKREIEVALELLQKELTNLRTMKNRLLESPSGAQRDEELENSITNERKLTDHMMQLKNAMAELNEHLEKLASTKV